MSLNQIVLTGNLGDDPEVFYSSQSGEPVTNFDLAFHRGKDKNGENKTGWIRCVAFRKTAEVVEQFLHKGARIAVTGCIDENVWVNEENQKRKNHQIIVNSIEFIKTDGRVFENGETPF